MSLLALTDILTQPTARQYVQDTLGSESWLTVYEHIDEPTFTGTVFSALIPDDQVPHALQHPAWDLRVGQGGPGFSTGPQGTVYDAWNLYDDVRPLAIRRTFHAMVEGAQETELIEEFRLFHNLAYVARDGEYLDVSSTPEAVARWECGRLIVKRKAVRQFLAAKGMHLALFFQLNRWSDEPVDAVPASERDARVDASGLVYELAVRSWDGGTRGQSFSKLIGKRMVRPLPLRKVEQWASGKQDRYETFVVGVDEDGDAIHHTANPDAVTYARSPYPTTTLHFRRGVLSRYYGDLVRYSIDRWRLRCGSLWSLELIDDDERGRVYVDLGDIGIIPYEEQQHWKAHNVEPEAGGRVATAYGSPEPAHEFREAYARTNAAWEAAFGWPLFRPLATDDQHNLAGLRVPLHETASEFDGQVLALAKTAVDSLDEARIQRAAVAEGYVYEGREAGIAKFAGYLEAVGFNAGGSGLSRPPTEWMKDVQWLRSSGSAHRKGSTYAAAAERFRIEERGRPAVMRDLIAEGTRAMDALAVFADERSEAAASETE